MKPLFTVHAGEYLVGSHIEACYPGWNVWLPSRDTGVDLLVTNGRNTKAVSLQVKFSKDFNPTNRPNLLQFKLSAVGWWTHEAVKLMKSRADFWIFVLPSFIERENHFIIIKPKALLRQLQKIHGRRTKPIHSYFLITKSGRCWEGRGLSNAHQEMIAFDQFRNATRDFTRFLNDWSGLKRLLKK